MDATVRSEFDDTSNSSDMKMARALGLFSLGLGVWQLASPRSVAKVVGIDDAPDENLIRAIGLRELGAAAGLLWGSQPAPYLWSRVAATSWTSRCSRTRWVRATATGGDRSRGRCWPSRP
jgi:hypothetical protein